jgi:protein-S-isoprenylcysteine O-methyltransferase Ste14
MSDLAYRYLFPALWLGWATYWWLSSRTVKAVVRQERVGSRLLHVLPLLGSLALIGLDTMPGPLLDERLFPWAPWQFWTGALVTGAGLAFCVWARVHIGSNWSGTVTLKAGHELIVTGPYAIVRHPIYTGLLTGIVGSALARGEWRGVLAIAIAWLALWRKLRLEERWMLELFDERYAAYRRRVPALLPLSGRRSVSRRAD